MSVIFRIFDPLWALIGRHMLLTAAVLTVALGAAILLHRPFLVLVLSTAVGAILMLKGEAGRPKPPHVHLPTSTA